MNFFSTLPAEVFDAIGVAGFGLYVLNYSLLTVQKLNAQQITYFVINLIAASMVLIGLIHAFNLASAMIQGFWIVISIYAIFTRIRSARPTAKHRTEATSDASETQVAQPFAAQSQPVPHLVDVSQDSYRRDQGSARRTQPHVMG